MKALIGILLLLAVLSCGHFRSQIETVDNIIQSRSYDRVGFFGSGLHAVVWYTKDEYGMRESHYFFFDKDEAITLFKSKDEVEHRVGVFLIESLK